MGGGGWGAEKKLTEVLFLSASGSRRFLFISNEYDLQSYENQLWSFLSLHHSSLSHVRGSFLFEKKKQKYLPGPG